MRRRWPVLAFLYLSSRLVALSALPMFLDERIHLRWAYWIAQGRRLRLPFISGRGLSVYLLAAVVPRLEDPLLAGRALTVAVGLATLFACHRLALRATGDTRVADLAALFYIACPFTLVYDRMVLTDAFLAAATALVLLLAMRVAEAPRPRDGLALGLALGLGVLAKTTGLLLFAVPVLALVLVAPVRRRALVPVAVSYAVAALLTAYPLWLFFRKTEELAGALGVRQNEASFTGNAAANLRLAFEWLWTYWTPPLALLALLRPMATMLAAVALAAVLWPALRFDLWLWTDPARAPFPALDRFQYVTGWPSGYGARDTIAFLRDERARHPGLLLVTPGPSTTASAVRLLWTRDASLDVRYVDPAETTPSALAAPGQGVLVVVSLIEGVRLPERWAPELVLAFSSFKPDGAPADQVYRLVSAGDGR